MNTRLACMLLICDLDETLLYADETPLSRPADCIVRPYYVYKRPYLTQFLLQCNQWFELAIWTGSSSAYAEAVLAELIPETVSLAFVFTGRRCTRQYDPETREYSKTKRLSKVKRMGYSLNQVLIIDDMPEMFRCNYGNGIQVTSYEGNTEDRELLDLLEFLDGLRNVEDVRSIEKRDWKHRQHR